MSNVQHARFATFLLVALFCGVAAPAQQNNPPTPAGNATIDLDVVVARKSGPPVRDLQQQDFTLLDNNVPQAITSFEAVTGRDAPLQVMLVVDAVNTGYEHVAYERTEIDKFFRTDAGHLAYPTALSVLTDRGLQVEGNPSTDGNALSTAMDRANVSLRTLGRSAGYYGAVERLQLSLQALSQLLAGAAPLSGRKVILWVSPGWPLLAGPHTEIDSNQRQQIFATLVSLSTQIRQSRVTLYSIDPLSADESLTRETYYEAFLKGVSTPDKVFAGDLGLQVLSIQSGGLALRGKDVSVLLRESLTDSVPYYRISFAAPRSKRRNEYHNLQIKLAPPGLTARTLRGYYAQP